MIPLNLKLHPEILSHPNIPKPLHGVNPRTIKGQTWWDTTRKKAYDSTDFHCISCGIHKSLAKYHQWLEAHEYYTIDYINGIMNIEKIIPLCHSCHNFIHSGLLTIKLRRNEIDITKFKDILQHGCNILSANNLKGFGSTLKMAEQVHCTNIPEKIPVVEGFASWEKWHLVLEGEKHYSKFKNFEEWSNHKW